MHWHRASSYELFAGMLLRVQFMECVPTRTADLIHITGQRSTLATAMLPTVTLTAPWEA